MQTPEQIFSNYAISPRRGFLADIPPLERLPEYFAPWETLAADLPSLIAKRQVRGNIDGLPVLETSGLVHKAEWQRAYSLLGFLTQAYIWSSSTPAEVGPLNPIPESFCIQADENDQYLPPSISRPFLAVAERLKLPPIANYSGLVLWNFTFKLSGCDPTNPEHIQALTTMTGTKDEEWFYMISVVVEARGGPLVAATVRCLEAMSQNDDPGILSAVESIANGIRDLTRLLSRIHDHCNPRVFYDKIRPMLSGTKVSSFDVLRRGVFYDVGDGHGLWRKYSGGSNAQSTLIQLLDIFLGVPHLGRDKTLTETPSVGSSVAPGGFLEEMQSYMPQEHREFLAHIAQSGSLRRYVAKYCTDTDIYRAYNDVVEALVSFRSVHIQIAARFIIQPSKGLLHPPTGDFRGADRVLTTRTWSPPDENAIRPELRGTGGTEFMSFLKKTRDETRDTVIESGDQGCELDRLSLASHHF
ncbi:hypothetical protein PV08_12044 [Exophiala spinifera]|uniref:Indoleamine 2,3-dioxygenase n=1 Tax=Exophiala spinifera TaxID=91928 RepID=A0A0D1Y419_9EURO|nr:uncharacterized protein PV08_12044 [Exophiala spinifera]KIW09701.1 hypothetical protein PV08_12044 [Exophiala spinifera]